MTWMGTIYQDDPKLKAEDVNTLLEWVKAQTHLPPITDKEIVLFLQSCYYSTQKAKNAIDNYFTMKTFSQEVFGYRNPKNPEIIKAMNLGVEMFLPQKTPEGYLLCYAKLVDCDPTNFVLAVALRVFDLLVLAHLHQQGPMKGLVVLIDMQGAVFGHLLKLNPLVVKKFLYYLQDAMPIRLKGVHFFNIVPFMDKIIAILKPFMKKELMDMMYFHDTEEGLLKFFPRDCLPKEYGGKADTISELQASMKKFLLDNVDFFLHQETQLVDERKRPGKSKNAGDVFGVEGSFKKLDID